MHEEHLSAYDSAIKAMYEPPAPLLRLSWSYVRSCRAIGFLGGLTGELYRQFAVTIAIAVVISGIVASDINTVIMCVNPEKRTQSLRRIFCCL